jgi:hypothetical protein
LVLVLLRSSLPPTLHPELPWCWLATLEENPLSATEQRVRSYARGFDVRYIDERLDAK